MWRYGYVVDDIGATSSDGISDTQLAERLHAGRVGFGNVGEGAAVFLHPHGVGVDPEHFVAHVDERGGQGGTEPAESDDNELAFVGDVAAEAAEHRVNHLVSQ